MLVTVILSYFEQLFGIDDTGPVHKRNPRTLSIKMYDILSPVFMRGTMTIICLPYNMRLTTKP